jgi:hypothetical protein
MPKVPELALDKQITEMVAAFSDPIIVYPGGWEDTVPEQVKQDIATYRLIRLMAGDLELATWPEVCAYFYTLTLCFPPHEQVTRMYMYAMTQYLRDNSPKELRQESLDDYDMNELNRFRRWIRYKQVEARKKRSHLEKRSVVSSHEAINKTQHCEERPSLFDFNSG